MYGRHIGHVLLLRRYYCKKKYDSAFWNHPSDVQTSHDYAKCLKAEFNLEIQSEHFGNSQSLSIEGSTVEIQWLRKSEPSLEFHSHFSDGKQQDACMKYAHMRVLFYWLIKMYCLVVILRG